MPNALLCAFQGRADWLLQITSITHIAKGYNQV